MPIHSLPQRVTRQVQVQLMALDLERDAFQTWLGMHNPSQPCGERASRSDNPLSRYLIQTFGVEEAIISSIAVRCMVGPHLHGAVFPLPVWALAFLAHLNQPGRAAAVTVAEAETALACPLRLTRALVASPAPPPIPASPLPPDARWKLDTPSMEEGMAAILDGLDQMLFSARG